MWEQVQAQWLEDYGFGHQGLFFTSGQALKVSTFSRHPVNQADWFSPAWGEDVQMVEVTAELGERFKLK